MCIRDRYKEEGIEIVGISLGAPPDMVKIFMDDKGVNYPVFHAERDVLAEYSVRAVPLNVFFGRDGKERMRELGYNEEKKKEIEEEVARLLKE